MGLYCVYVLEGSISHGIKQYLHQTLSFSPFSLHGGMSMFVALMHWQQGPKHGRYAIWHIGAGKG